MILLIDNYDSFSYNLVQLLGSIEPQIRVVRNDEITVDEIRRLAPSHLILSPGPGRPADAGILEEVVATLKGEIPILGVCLGHQGICEVFGAEITYAKTLMHGKQSVITLNEQDALFAGLPQQIQVGRYHSLAANAATMPACLAMIAQSDDGEVMAVKHQEFPIYGLQFHPESVLTPQGRVILENFLKIR